MAEAIVSTIAIKVVEIAVDQFTRPFRYLLYKKENIENVADEVRNLDYLTSRVRNLVDIASMNAEVITHEVTVWLMRVEMIQMEALQLIEYNARYLNRWCPNLKSRYSLSRKACKIAETMVELQYRGRKFSEVLALNAHEFAETMVVGGSKFLPSRMTMEQEIAAALKNDTISMIAICGVEGIGKTTMALQLLNIVKLELLFEEIVMIVVSKNVDVINIQKEIAELLGLRLQQRSIFARAERLRERLTCGKQILLLLDDVWEELDMGAIGIPTGDGCKVIFTSRNENVCHKMGGQTFTIEPLSDEEAWNLLKEIAGKCVDSPSVYPIAKEVAKNCKGLPRLIVNLGANLRNRENYDWLEALQDLRKSARTKNTGSDREAYLAIELIYDNLENVEAKSLFRLCCRFPKDEEIRIELLIRYSLGLQLFEGEKTLVEAREEVELLVKELKKRNLLADAGSHEEFVKVPDVAWDVGRDKSRAKEVRNEYLLLLNGENGLKESSEYDKFDPYTSISIYSNEMHELPDDYLDCAGLKLLSFQCSHDELEISGDLFEGIRDLQVMDLRINTLEPLPPSLKFLSNLRALYLDFSNLGDVSLIGSLHELEILSFFNSEIGVLPSKIRQLRKLKLLDLRCKSGPKKINAGVLSGLKQLEELYTGTYFDPRNAVEKGAKAIELNSLPCLTALQISLTLDNYSLRNFKKFKFQNLKRFDFSMFDMESILTFPRYHFSNSVVLNGVDMSQVSDNVIELMKKSEGLTLDGVEKTKNNIHDFIELDKEVFVNLKRLNVSNSIVVRYVIDTAVVHSDQENIISNLVALDMEKMYNLMEMCNGDLPMGSFGRLEEITLTKLHELRHLWRGQIQSPSLSKLRVVKMQECGAITSLFPSSVVNCLVQLQELKITQCRSLKEVVSKEALIEDTKKMEFPKLKILSLAQLPKFRSFYPQPNVYCGSYDIDETTEHLFNQQKLQVSLANMEELDVRELNIHVLILGDQMQAWSLNNLRVVRVFECMTLQAVFDFGRLQPGVELEEVMFDQLETLHLYDLPILRYIWRKVPKGIQGFCNLKTLQVSTCGGLTYLLSVSMPKILKSLEDLMIKNCEAMREVVGTEEEESSSMTKMTETIKFPRLRYLALEDLESLQMFYSRNHCVEFPLLEKILLTNCPRMKTFCSGQVKAPQLERIDVKNNDTAGWVWKGDLNKTVEFLGGKGLKMQKTSSH